jgi:hypothetical protein
MIKSLYITRIVKLEPKILFSKELSYENNDIVSFLASKEESN